MVQTAKSVVKPADLQVGNPVPLFSLAGTRGENVDIQNLRGKKVVLYFYPKDATPGCTIEGQDFSKLHEQFKSLNCVIYGISRDNLKSHESFKEKQGFKFELLSDVDENVCRLFDVIKEKNMYGRKVMGIERSTFVLDSQGNLAAEWRKVKVPGHAQEVLEKCKSIN